jgi:membrane protease YdiL (CAAX protease family)
VEWLQRQLWAWWLSIVFVSLFVLLQLVFPVVQVSIKYRNRPFLEPRQFEPLRFFLPSSRLERRWWVALSLTAAFCEELLFRGFLLHYLHTSPWRLGLVWASLFAAAVFGAHHLYQGAKGFVGAGIGALVFTAILLLTGSLWVSMIYHAAADLSLLLCWRPKPTGGGTT